MSLASLQVREGSHNVPARSSKEARVPITGRFADPSFVVSEYRYAVAYQESREGSMYFAILGTGAVSQE
jgi:hypothetical protein